MKNLYMCDLEYLPIIFPDYKVVRECEYVKKGWIYIGHADVPGDMEAICLSPFLNKTVNLSLPDNVAVVKFAYGRKGKDIVPSQILKHVGATREKLIFMGELKRFMAVGKWEISSDVDAKIYKMFGALIQDHRQFLNQYFILRETYSFEHIWESLLTFFRRVVDAKADTSKFSSYYRRQIDSVRVYRDRISGILALFSRNHFDEAVVLDFILGLRFN